MGRAYAESVAPQIQAEFAGAGRYGSGLQQAAESLSRQDMASQMGNIASNIYAQAYEAERDRMLKQSALAPAYQSMDYTDLQNLAAVGDVVDQKAREILASDIQKYEYPQNQLDRYVGRVASLGGQGFGTTNTTEPVPGSSLAGGILGGAQAGLGIANQFQSISNPVGAIGGAILGGLFK